MNIQNSTKWNTKELRKFFLECVRRVDKIEKPTSYAGSRLNFRDRDRRFNRGFSLIFQNRSGSCLYGRATINGAWIKIHIGEDIQWTDKYKISLAQLITHEYYHTIGFRSQDRCNYKYDWTQKINYNWAISLPITVAIPKVKEKPDLIQLRYQKVIEKTNEWNLKFQRAKNLLRKYQQKKNRYEKVLASRKSQS